MKLSEESKEVIKITLAILAGMAISWQLVWCLEKTAKLWEVYGGYPR